MNFARIFDVQNPDLGAIASNLFVAAVELVCGYGAGGDSALYFFRPAAGFFLIIALLFIWTDVVRASEVTGGCHEH